MATVIIWGIVIGQVVGLVLIIWVQRGDTTYRSLTYSEGLKLTEQSIHEVP